MESKRRQLDIMRGQLENERATFMAHWRDLGDYILPRRPRFTTSDVNQGDRRNQKIIDSTATLAARTLRAGMMSGVTSPARPWFRLATPDPSLLEVQSVKEYLHTVSNRMTTVFLKSNLYNVLPIVYGDIGVFGTSAVAIEEDMDDVVRFYPFAVGSYMIANNQRLKVDVFHRDFRMTVRQLVEKFGKRDLKTGELVWDNFSSHVKSMWERSELETWIDVSHSIRPNPEYNPDKLHAKHKRYSSCYYETGANGSSSFGSDQERYLREWGYDYFPILCPRWEVTGEDAYGTTCPGMDALGDIKQLQMGEKRIAQAIDKMINPPMTGPSQMRNSKASILPGDITYVDIREGQGGFRPSHEVRFSVNEAEMKQAQVRERVRRAFFEDLFLMLANSDRRQITAREIEERHEEKLLALGPVLEQLNQDLLDPLIDVTFDIMNRQRLLPEPPQELQGMALKVEYISVMAQAQKLVGIGGIERFAGFVGQIAQVSPTVLDKVDADQMIDEYGDAIGISPKIIRSDDNTASMRGQRAQAEQAQQQMMAVQQGAAAAKDLSQSSLETDSALKRLLEQANAGAMGGVQ